MTKLRFIAPALALAAAGASFAVTAPAHAAEGCGVVYSAGQTQVARCTYAATAPGGIVATSVNWKVTVVHPGGTFNVYSGSAPTYQPSSGLPIKAGDTVTAEVNGPGSVIVGSATEGNNVVPPKP